MSDSCCHQSYVHQSTPIPLKKYNNNGAYSFPKEIPRIPVKKEDKISSTSSSLNPTPTSSAFALASLNINRDSQPVIFENSQLNSNVPQFNIPTIM